MSNTSVHTISDYLQILYREYPGFATIIKELFFQWVDTQEAYPSNPLAPELVFRLRNANSKGASFIEILALLPPQQWSAFQRYSEAWIQEIVGQDSPSIQEERWERYIEQRLDTTHNSDT